jgi:hypothetical protein
LASDDGCEAGLVTDDLDLVVAEADLGDDGGEVGLTREM